MEPVHQTQIVKRVQEQRESFEELLVQLYEHGDPLSAAEARRLIEDASARLLEVEHFLRHDARFAEPLAPAWLRRALLRLRGLKRPRIGTLRHYPPRPLYVPASYLRATPPERPPTISIVTPSFQQGQFLERTLYSVIGQSYPGLEYVVQDGGSTDETLEVLARAGGSLTAWASAPDNGQGDAINRGFRTTTGEIMGWLNSDDLLLPGALAYVARYFSTHPEVDVVYGHRIMIDEDDNDIGAWILPAHDDLALTLVDFVPQETLFWRRAIWDAAGGEIDESFGYALDWDLLLRFRAAGANIVRLPRFLGSFRVHDEQKTSMAHALGLAECARLRLRTHGRAVSIADAVAQLRPYLRRHVLIHTLYRLSERLPRRRVLVDTLPPAAGSALRGAARGDPSPLELRPSWSDATETPANGAGPAGAKSGAEAHER